MSYWKNGRKHGIISVKPIMNLVIKLASSVLAAVLPIISLANDESLEGKSILAPNYSRSLVLFNDDGDFTFVGNNPDEWRSNLAKMLAPLKTVPVQGLVYALGTGTDVLLYPSSVGSSWGWRSMELPEKAKHIKSFPIAVQSGFDGVRWAAEDADKQGLLFIPAFRVNDAHYTSGAAPYLEGRFWVENRTKFTFSTPPYPSDKVTSYKELLDFTYPEVREHRLGVIREAIKRYQDTMDGFLLDFMRTPAFFTLDTAAQKSGLMTDWLSAVRAALDKAEVETGRKLPLLVRVPPTIKNSEKIGLNIKEWLSRGLVQVVLPAQGMTLAQDTPLDEFIQAASPYGAKVYASILERSAHNYAFGLKAPQSSEYVGRNSTSELLRGAAINYRHMGVGGFELYNFNLPLRGHQMPGIAAFSGTDGDLAAAARTYSVTPAYFIDHLDIFESPKQLPMHLSGSDGVSLVRIYVGENPSLIPATYYVGLRVGLAVKASSPMIKMSLNDVELASDSEELSISNPEAKSGPKTYIQVRIKSPELALVRGWNTLEINYPGAERLTVSEVQIGVIP